MLGAACLTLVACKGGSGSGAGVSAAGVVSFSNGEAASVVIGQPDFTSNSTATTRTGANDPYGNPDVINGVLYLPDTSNGRVLGFNSIPTSNGAPADFVLGAPDFTTTGTLYSPWTVADYAGRLYVPEESNNDIAVYDTIPTAVTSPPSATSSPTPAFTITASTVGGLSYASSIAVGGGKFVVADTQHSRVLIWNSVPTSDTPPDLVLGQTDFTGTGHNQGGSPSARTMNAPAGVWTDGQRLVVLDTTNSRVLIWNTFPTTNDQPADLVLGQADFSSVSSNRGGSTAAANTLSGPYGGVWVNGSQLFITDSFNHRVLIWKQWPTTNGQAADTVLGQPNFTWNGIGTTASRMYRPGGLYLYGSQLIVTDGYNNRYLVFNGTY